MAKICSPRNNHNNTALLLAIPQYSDLLDDNNIERRCDDLLVMSKAKWRVGMAVWIGESQQAEEDEILKMNVESGCK